VRFEPVTWSTSNVRALSTELLGVKDRSISQPRVILLAKPNRGKIIKKTSVPPPEGDLTDNTKISKIDNSATTQILYRA